MKKSFIIIFVSLIILIGLFIFLRPPQEIKLPISDSNDSSQKIPPGVSGIKRFSDAKKNIAPTAGTDKAGNVISDARNTVPEVTAKPLPYPRISLNYSIRTVNSIRGNIADSNSTFVIVAVDIRNYGYIYFDAYPRNFKGLIRGDQIVPLINISTGNMIDAVIPNNSRAKGDLVFLIDNSKWMTGITFSPINKSISYYILYQELSPSEMGDQKVGVTHEED